MARLNMDTWKTIYNNLKENNEEVEVVWLDGTQAYVLCFECELFENGFESENEAYKRLEYIESIIL